MSGEDCPIRPIFSALASDKEKPRPMPGLDWWGAGSGLAKVRRVLAVKLCRVVAFFLATHAVFAISHTCASNGDYFAILPFVLVVLILAYIGHWCASLRLLYYGYYIP